MWESEFADLKKWSTEEKVKKVFISRLKAEEIERIQLLYWREHCLECAPPDCYHTCPLYEKRRDKRCVRVAYGICQNRDLQGLFKFGADIRFKKWAKLGTFLYPSALKVENAQKYQQFDIKSSLVINILFNITNPFNPLDLLRIKFHNPQRQLFKAQTFVREKLLQKIPTDSQLQFDCFVIECFSFEKSHFNLIVEHTSQESTFRDSVIIQPGHNYHEISASKFGSEYPKGSLVVYPENDLQARLIFTWLDMVKKKATPSVTVSHERPSEKVKCVAWDLDNTLWPGVLIDKGKEEISISSEIIDIIKRLDERGIIQTIVSKNEHTEAWDVIKKHHLEEYFLYPAINWAPKSSNLRQIAEKININIDTFALIDDSPFERAEVESVLPQVRIYTEKEIFRILGYNEFDVPVTEASRERRKSYLVQMQRETVQEQFRGDYRAFLRDCQMNLRIFYPDQEHHVKRCLELVQRSNQLNLSTKRYSEGEFRELITSQNVSTFALHCTDRFGDYGIIGFASVDERGKSPQLLDFVISCRVAQKRVEHAFIEWLGKREKARGYFHLIAALFKTKKNGPLVRVFEEMPFQVKNQDGESITYELDLNNLNPVEDIITIIDETTK